MGPAMSKALRAIHALHLFKRPRTGVPYCEYFTVQTRWVITRVGVTTKRCRLQIGLDVPFRQNVLLK